MCCNLLYLPLKYFIVTLVKWIVKCYFGVTYDPT